MADKDDKNTMDVEVVRTSTDLESLDEVQLEKQVNANALTKRLLTLGVETRGIHPVPESKRLDKQYYKIFFIWFTCNFNILSFSAGTLGPVAFELGVKESCLVIWLFTMLCSVPPAYFATWGPRLGLRQMVQSRYSFGYYGVILPCVLNLISMTGFCILNTILGGQTLAAVADGNLSWTVGIVIIAIISLFLSFCGYDVLNWYERVAWFPVLVVYLVALGVGGKNLSSVPPPEPVTAARVLSFASTIAGFVITYSGLASDFTIYYRSDAPSWKIFFYTFFGFTIPIALILCLGAAVAAAAPSIPLWAESSGTPGGLLLAMLTPAGRGFAKFLTVLLALSVTGNIAVTFYSISLNVQVFIPKLVVVPRYAFSIAATAIVLPLSIVGAHRFYDTLLNFLSIIGYWASAYVAIILGEHVVFRRLAFSNYDLNAWNQPGLLPTGIAALAAGILSFGLVVPCMDQIWFVGPIAKKGAGDIGFEVAFFISGVLYLPFRALEIRLRGKL
ncbi:cytosine-purine permease [Moniliophthora roreri MCA 2997]|uniref:Cytosine-purine permease n=1 Tax=Moniliophthora roreri (strain MCA 2997) TaxID=1381753 RepID=V2X1D9_MONRO|nr:cytosine-purine permease [Moniliophthora roreri MCA 2997]